MERLRFPWLLVAAEEEVASAAVRRLFIGHASVSRVIGSGSRTSGCRPDVAESLRR